MRLVFTIAATPEGDLHTPPLGHPAVELVGIDGSAPTLPYLELPDRGGR